MRYKTPAALEMAVKEAAKNSPLDTNRAIAGFYFHRLLCRVFSDPDSPFVLKGGQSVLARTVFWTRLAFKVRKEFYVTLN